MARPHLQVHERLWWLDVVYPLALATLLFTSLTYIVYAGPRQSRLSLAGERKLLEFSLRQSTPARPAPDPRVLVISADPLDVASLGRAPRGRSPDVTAATYARVLTRLAEDGVPLAVVLWDAEAHPADEVYYLPLTEALRRIAGTTRVYLATPPDAFEQLPAAVRALALRADNGPCSEDSVNIECTYLGDYKDWLAQKLVTELGVVPEGAETASLQWLSTQLSSVYQRYILNLKTPQSLTTLSFRQLLHGSPEAMRGVRVAFIGADQGGALSGVGSSTYTRHVLTIFDAPQTDLEVAGTPLHVFWAQVGQMFLGKAMVNVPPGWAIAATAAVFCLLIIVAMSLFGGPAALGMFLVVAGCGPFVNALGIRYLQVYLPLFDSYYFGLSTFVAAGLGRLSVTAFHRWRLEAERRMHAHAADLRGNFISLLSHNLNTPVAKMQGMLALLSGQAAAAPWAAELRAADALVAQLEHSIRCVLIASALEEGSVAETARTVRTISSEFAVAVAPGLRRLGLAVTVQAPESLGDESLQFLPLAFDMRAMTAGIGALAALLLVPDRRCRVHVTFGVKEENDDPYLTVTLVALDSWLPPSAAMTLAEAATQMPGAPRRLSGDSFFCDVLTGLAMLVVRQYKGSVVFAPEAPGGCIEVTLAPTRQASSERLA